MQKAKTMGMIILIVPVPAFPPPGTWYAWFPTNGPGMHVRTAPEAAFTDANGRSWVRRGNGKLEEIETEPISFYGRGLPVSWGECKGLD